MAGAGSRFEQAGYTFPKPLIEVRKKPMIQVVVENLNIKANYIYVVQKSHREKYNLDALLSLITPGCKVVETEGMTEGAACTALLAREYINTDAPLFFANSLPVLSSSALRCPGFLLQTLQGLEYLHRLWILHRVCEAQT